MSDDRNNFDNPVYSYQQTSVNTDASTLLHRNGVLNNLRQTKPSNMDRLNNFDHDSESSGRAAAYSLHYDSQLMNQKNMEADQTNPNFYNGIDDDHLYDEIKLKSGDLGKNFYLKFHFYEQFQFILINAHTPGDKKLNNYENNQSLSNETYDHPLNVSLCAINF